jgi:hypothetical protein
VKRSDSLMAERMAMYLVERKACCLAVLWDTV